MNWDGVARLIAVIVTFGWSLTWPDEPPPAEHPTEAATPKEGMDEATLRGLIAAIGKCWNIPVAPAAEPVRVRLYVEFDRSGHVTSTKALTPEGPDLSADGVASIAAAERAVKSCQPYDLPEPLYEGWRTMIINFDPSLVPRQVK